MEEEKVEKEVEEMEVAGGGRGGGGGRRRSRRGEKEENKEGQGGGGRRKEKGEKEERGAKEKMMTWGCMRVGVCTCQCVKEGGDGGRQEECMQSRQPV